MDSNQEEQLQVVNASQASNGSMKLLTEIDEINSPKQDTGNSTVKPADDSQTMIKDQTMEPQTVTKRGSDTVVEGEQDIEGEMKRMEIETDLANDIKVKRNSRCGCCAASCFRLRHPEDFDQKRVAFIVKVYALVLVMNLVTVGFTVLVVSVEPLQTWMKAHAFVHYIFIAPALIGYLAISFERPHKWVTTPGWRWVYLIAFNLVMTYVVGGFASHFGTFEVLYASICMFALMIPLTLLAIFLPDGSVKYWHAILTSTIVLIWPAMLFGLKNPGSTVFYIVFALLLILFAVYIVYDTRRLLEIWFLDEIVPASIMLYFDFAMMFVVLLYILAKNR